MCLIIYKCMYVRCCVCGGVGAADFLAVSYLQHAFLHTHHHRADFFLFLSIILAALMMSVFFFRLRARAPEFHHSVIKHKFIKNIYSLIKNVKRLRISGLTAPMHDDVDERTTKFIILIWLLVGAFSIP